MHPGHEQNLSTRCHGACSPPLVELDSAPGGQGQPNRGCHMASDIRQGFAANSSPAQRHQRPARDNSQGFACQTSLLQIYSRSHNQDQQLSSGKYFSASNKHCEACWHARDAPPTVAIPPTCIIQHLRFEAAPMTTLIHCSLGIFLYVLNA